MNKTVFWVVLLLLMFIAINLTYAQWISIGGPGGVRANKIITNGNSLFVSSFSGLFISTNDGLSWDTTIFSQKNITPIDIWTMFADSTKVYISTVNEVFLSTDNGLTWTEKSKGIENNIVGAFVKNGKYLFAGIVEYGYIFRSEDDGANWIKIDSTSINSSIEALTASPDGKNIYAGTLNGVFISTNDGSSWQSTNSGMIDSTIHSLVFKGTNLFAGTNRGVYKSTDSGENWSLASTGLTDSTIFVLGLYGMDILAGTFKGLYISSNDGESWSAANTLPLGSNPQTIAVKRNILFVGADDGVYKSTDEGSNWRAANFGLPSISPIASLTINDSCFYASCGDDIIYSSTDQGANWRKMSDIDPMSSGLPLSAFMANGASLFAATVNGIFRSTDNGTSWIGVNDGLANLNVYAFASLGNKIYAGTRGMYTSTDNGAKWTIDSGLIGYGIRTIAVKDSSIYAGTSGGVFFSMNNGVTWNPANMGFTYPVIAIALIGNIIFGGTEYTGVVRSTDNGVSWTYVNNGFPNFPDLTIYSLITYSSNLLTFIKGGVYLSTDNGNNWSIVGSNLLRQSIGKIAISGDYIYAATSSGIMRIPLPAAINNVKQSNSTFPLKFRLMQNYPNPFNPSTIISFRIPSKSFVSLKVFDMLGREVSVLASEILSAGNYSNQFNGSDFPSGIYFYRLQAGSYSETKKMILLK